MYKFRDFFFNPESHEEVCRCGNVMKCRTTFSHRQHHDIDCDFYTDRTFKVLTCSRCDFATVMLYKVGGDSYTDQEETESSIQLEREWERLILYAPERQIHQAIPKNISEVFNQAEAVLASSPRASFILCRAVLEEICNDFNIPTEGTNNKGKTYFINLHERLIQLFKKEMISVDLQDVIQGIKDLGNEGAHSNHEAFKTQVTSQEADDLLALVDFVLDRLYVDKARQQEASEKLNRLKARFSS